MLLFLLSISGESSREEEETDGRAGGSGVATSREERSRNLEELVVEKSRVEVSTERVRWEAAEESPGLKFLYAGKERGWKL